jgi:hypothetical protein
MVSEETAVMVTVTDDLAEAFAEAVRCIPGSSELRTLIKMIGSLK